MSGSRYQPDDPEAWVSRARRNLRLASVADPEVHLEEPKRKKSRRTIDLPQVTLSALAAHRMRQAEERTQAESRWTVPTVQCEGRLEPPEEFVFTTSTGTPAEARNVTKRFQRVLGDAKIPRRRFHDLRLTAARLPVVQGLHAKAIRAVLRCDQVAMTERYAHFVYDMRKEATAKMDIILVRSPARATATTKAMWR